MLPQQLGVVDGARPRVAQHRHRRLARAGPAIGLARPRLLEQLADAPHRGALEQHVGRRVLVLRVLVRSVELVGLALGGHGGWLPLRWFVRPEQLDAGAGGVALPRRPRRERLPRHGGGRIECDTVGRLPGEEAGEDPVHRGRELRVGAEAGGEVADLGSTALAALLEQVHLGAAEPVDGLLGVADGEEPRRQPALSERSHQGVDEADLRRVGVLELVHQDVVKGEAGGEVLGRGHSLHDLGGPLQHLGEGPVAERPARLIEVG